MALFVGSHGKPIAIAEVCPCPLKGWTRPALDYLRSLKIFSAKNKGANIIDPY